jgi:hypothetical protein
MVKTVASAIGNETIKVIGKEIPVQAYYRT